jgi:hypothetical protein
MVYLRLLILNLVVGQFEFQLVCRRFIETFWMPACAGMKMGKAYLNPPRRHARESGHPVLSRAAKSTN